MCRHVVTLSKKKTCIFKCKRYNVCSPLCVCVRPCLISTNCNVFISVPDMQWWRYCLNLKCFNCSIFAIFRLRTMTCILKWFYNCSQDFQLAGNAAGDATVLHTMRGPQFSPTWQHSNVSKESVWAMQVKKKTLRPIQWSRQRPSIYIAIICR